ncbi:DJ-1/PfpI family protein [Crocinitomicaceae bacterium]|nr:DJ-1/PfpI family protein [Crocinitomicaceae bacterium]
MKFFLVCIPFALALSCANKTEQKAEQTKSSVELKEGNYNVAFLITDGTYNTEFTAPWDIFDHVRFRDVEKGMNLFTVSNTNDPITTFEGLKITPDFNFLKDKIPHIDILVIPSAEHHLDSDLQDKKLIDFVKKTSENATWVTSHCDGAFLLAKAGMLDGKHCTTFPADIQAMRDMFNKPIVKDSVWFVHDDKYITSVGGAKSFEASLYLCELLYGKQNAKDLAEGLVIDWDLSGIPWETTMPLPRTQ